MFDSSLAQQYCASSRKRAFKIPILYSLTWRAMPLALGVGMACTLVFLVLLWRSVGDTVLGFFPLALMAALTGAALTGDRMNVVNVIVPPMLVGMGGDSGDASLDLIAIGVW